MLFSPTRKGEEPLFLFMMPSFRRPHLVFLREGGDGGLRRWSFLTPLVEAPTGDIISSSLNGFSLRVFSVSGLPELDIFRVRKGLFFERLDGARHDSESGREGSFFLRHHRRDL